MNKKMRELLAVIEANSQAATAVNDKAVDHVLSEADQTEFDSLVTKGEGLKLALAREQSLMDQAADLGTDDITTQIDGSGEVIVGVDRATLDPKGGFASFGEFASKVMGARLSGGVDDRLIVDAAAPGTLSKEAVEDHALQPYHD